MRFAAGKKKMRVKSINRRSPEGIVSKGIAFQIPGRLTTIKGGKPDEMIIFRNTAGNEGNEFKLADRTVSH